MKRNIALIFSLLCMVTLSAGLSAMAQNPYRVSDSQVQQLLSRLESHTNDYRSSLNLMLERSRFDTNTEADVKGFVRDFEQATNQLLDRFRSRRSVSSDVEEVLTRGWQIDNFMRTNQLGAQTERNWRLVRTDLQTLAGYYNVSWRWDDRSYTPASNPVGTGNRYRNDQRGDQRNGTGGRYGNQSTSRLTGTYRLNPARSDNVQQAANRATRGLNSQDADRVRASLQRRLDAPEQIALEQQGRHITIASSSAPQAEIDADGREQTETRASGRMVRTVASLTGNGLSINSTGDRGSDFSVTFEPIDNGRSLQVTKTIYTDRLTQPVVVRSLYTRASDVAQWNIYDSNRTAPNNYDRYSGNTSGRDSRFAIPNGTMLTATLNEDLTTRQTREGDRFTMTVRSPGEFNGAVIEGIVTKADRSGRVTGRSELSLEFQRLQMRGRTYEFGGFIESVRTANGEDVRVNNEGTVKEDDSQTTRTVTRSGIGAALGAIIGGIAGGGSGAAIGAAVGAGAGAGSVLVQGRDDLDLARGTEFSIRASAPRANY